MPPHASFVKAASNDVENDFNIDNHEIRVRVAFVALLLTTGFAGCAGVEDVNVTESPRCQASSCPFQISGSNYLNETIAIGFIAYGPVTGDRIAAGQESAVPPSKTRAIETRLPLDRILLSLYAANQSQNRTVDVDFAMRPETLGISFVVATENITYAFAVA